jgi:hypothetical protein
MVKKRYTKRNGKGNLSKRRGGKLSKRRGGKLSKRRGGKLSKRRGGKLSKRRGGKLSKRRGGKLSKRGNTKRKLIHGGADGGSMTPSSPFAPGSEVRAAARMAEIVSSRPHKRDRDVRRPENAEIQRINQAALQASTSKPFSGQHRSAARQEENALAVDCGELEESKDVCESPKKPRRRGERPQNACKYVESKHGLNECLPSDYKYSITEGYGMNVSTADEKANRRRTNRQKRVVQVNHMLVGPYVSAQEVEVSDLTQAVTDSGGVDWESPSASAPQPRRAPREYASSDYTSMAGTGWQRSPL